MNICQDIYRAVKSGPMKLHQLVQQEIEKTSIGQVELAQKVGVAQGTISAMVKRNHEPTEEYTVAKFKKYFRLGGHQAIVAETSSSYGEGSGIVLTRKAQQALARLEEHHERTKTDIISSALCYLDEVDSLYGLGSNLRPFNVDSLTPEAKENLLRKLKGSVGKVEEKKKEVPQKTRHLTKRKVHGLR